MMSPKAGQEMPSIADELATLQRIAALHSAGSCRYEFVSRRLFFFMAGIISKYHPFIKGKGSVQTVHTLSTEMKSIFSDSGFLNNCRGRFGKTPLPVNGKRCESRSLMAECLPKTIQKRRSVKNYLTRILQEP